MSGADPSRSADAVGLILAHRRTTSPGCHGNWRGSTAGDTKPCYDALGPWKGTFLTHPIHGLSSRRGRPPSQRSPCTRCAAARAHRSRGHRPRVAAHGVRPGPDAQTGSYHPARRRITGPAPPTQRYCCKTALNFLSFCSICRAWSDELARAFDTRPRRVPGTHLRRGRSRHADPGPIGRESGTRRDRWRGTIPGTFANLHALAFVLIVLGFCSTWEVRAAGRCDPGIAEAVSVQGRVEVKRSSAQEWQSVRARDTFCVGDSIRVGNLSRAAIRIPGNEAVIRLDEYTTLTFKTPKGDRPFWLQLLHGVLHFLSPGPSQLDIDTPFISAQIEGTELVMRVGHARTSIWVFEGTVWATNPVGSVRLERGEGATAGVNLAPERRLVAKPRDAVQ